MTLLQPLAFYSYSSLHKLIPEHSDDCSCSASSSHNTLCTVMLNAVGQWVATGFFGGVLLFEHGEPDSEVGCSNPGWRTSDISGSSPCRIAASGLSAVRITAQVFLKSDKHRTNESVAQRKERSTWESGFSILYQSPPSHTLLTSTWDPCPFRLFPRNKNGRQDEDMLLDTRQ